MTSEPVRPRAFAVWFKDLKRWSVNSFFSIDWQWPAEYIRPLSTALTRRQNIVDRSQNAFNTLQLVTIRFDGSIEPRDIGTRTGFVGTLFVAAAGDVIYSKIDVRNGAIGIVPPEMPQVAVSSEFPVYRVKSEIADPRYITLLLRTAAFRRTINSMISGASGRKRVQPEQLEEIQVPLPPLPIQQAIVALWEAAQAEIVALRARFLHTEGITATLLDSLELKPPKLATVPKAFAISWKEFHRWGVSYNKATQSSSDLTLGKYPVVDLGSILEIVQYGTSEKANIQANGTAILRINNIKDDAISFTALKHIQLSQKVVEQLKLHDGDILIIRTSGSRDLVGSCAVFHERGDGLNYVYASYLIRLRVRPVKAVSDYVSLFLNSPLGRQQIDAVSRQIMQSNINTEELRGLRVPLPPLDVQREIIQQVQTQRQEMAHLREQAERKTREIKSEVEALILGTKQIEEN